MKHVLITVGIVVFGVLFGFGTCAMLAAGKIADLEAKIVQLREQVKIEHQVGWDEAMQTTKVLMQKKRAGGRRR